MFPQLNICY